MRADARCAGERTGAVVSARGDGWVEGAAAHKFGGWFYAESAGCACGRFSHWWRSVWVSVFGEGGFQTSVVLASTVLLGCQKRKNRTLGQLTSPRFESAFFASFLCRFGQRNDAPPRAVANSDKEIRQPKQTKSLESSNPALTPTATSEPRQNPNPRPPARAKTTRRAPARVSRALPLQA